MLVSPVWCAQKCKGQAPRQTGQERVACLHVRVAAEREPDISEGGDELEEHGKERRVGADTCTVREGRRRVRVVVAEVVAHGAAPAPRRIRTFRFHRLLGKGRGRLSPMDIIAGDSAPDDHRVATRG
jgi:hypothetical protein